MKMTVTSGRSAAASWAAWAGQSKKNEFVRPVLMRASLVTSTP
jgi:hypothetical protein